MSDFDSTVFSGQGTVSIKTNENGQPINRHGTRISVHTCDVCGRPFTVCPAVNHTDWGGACLDTTCISYDPDRDADRY